MASWHFNIAALDICIKKKKKKKKKKSARIALFFFSNINNYDITQIHVDVMASKTHLTEMKMKKHSRSSLERFYQVDPNHCHSSAVV